MGEADRQFDHEIYDPISNIYTEARQAFVGCGLRAIIRTNREEEFSEVLEVVCPRFPESDAYARPKTHGFRLGKQNKEFDHKDSHDPQDQELIGMQMGCHACEYTRAGQEIIVDAEEVSPGNIVPTVELPIFTQQQAEVSR